MVPGVNIEQVKQYNNSLKEYRDKAAKIQAAIEFNEKELDRLCQELTTSLGITVTVDNLEQVRDEFIAKINNTLTTGMDIINRIKSEEEMMSEGVQVQDGQVSPYTKQVISNTAPQAPQTPPQQAPQTPPQQAPQTPPQQAPQAPIFASLGEIPPIFGQI